MSLSKKYYTVCPGSSDPFYVVSYNIKWVTTSWTHSTTDIVATCYLYQIVTQYKLRVEKTGLFFGKLI